MRTSATGIWTKPISPNAARLPNRAARHGFTLVELLVVVVIIGLFAGVAVLSLGVLGSDRELERESRRLQSLMELVHEEALMQGRDFGVLFSATSYRFVLFDYQTGAWLETANDDYLRERQLPQPLRLSLRLDDRDVVLDENLIDVLEASEPQVLVLSSGEMTPFEAAFQRDLSVGQFRLTAQFNGVIELSEADFQDN